MVFEKVVSRKRLVISTLTVAIVLTGVASALYLFTFGPSSTQSSTGTGTTGSIQNLPAGCKKPSDGYLIVASINSFNDSISHGAPSKPWPIITVHKGDNVKLVVCNTDTQAHGFQVANYFDRHIETIAPRQVLTISFNVDKLGTFNMYCSIFCSVHIYMQNAQLRVVP